MSSNAKSDDVKALTSLDEFKAKIAGDTPVLIDFWATWCGPCRVISPIFDKFSKQIAGVEFYNVDVDAQQDISREVGIKAMPTFMLFRKGEKVGELVGAVPLKLEALVNTAKSLAEIPKAPDASLAIATEPLVESREAPDVSLSNAAATANTSATRFIKDDTVVLTGLNRAEMNGKTATVISADHAEGKAVVRVEALDRTFKVKLENLKMEDDLEAVEELEPPPPSTLRKSLARDTDGSTANGQTSHETSGVDDRAASGGMQDTYEHYSNYGQRGKFEVRNPETAAPPLNLESRRPERPTPSAVPTGTSRNSYGTYHNYGQHISDGAAIITGAKTLEDDRTQTTLSHIDAKVQELKNSLAHDTYRGTAYCVYGDYGQTSHQFCGLDDRPTNGDHRPALDLQGGHSAEDAHASSSADAMSMSSNACLSAAVDVMDRLVESKARIEALFHDIGINHKDLAIAAGFDEEVFASSGMLIQQAYLLTCVDLAVDEDQIVRLLDALGKMLSPYSGVISTPSRKYYSNSPANLPPSCLSSHNNQSLAKEQGTKDGNKEGNDQKQMGEGGSDHEATRESPQSDSASGDNTSDDEGNRNMPSVETNGSEAMPSVRHVASDFPPNDDPPETPEEAGHNVHFEVKFNIKHMYMPNQEIIVEGIVHSEEIPKGSLPHATPHAILSTRIQFLRLNFYGPHEGRTGYRQSCAVVKIDVGKDQGRFQLFDVNPQPTPRQDTKMKQVESTERTGQHQIGFLTNFTFPPLKTTLGGNYIYTTLRKSGTAEERSININRITQTKTSRETYWCYTVDDEYLQESGLRDLAPSASFSFFGAEKKPEKLKIEIKSIWTMPDSGVWNIYTLFTNTIPLRSLATQVAFDIPPHMNRSWTVFRDLAFTTIPRDKGFGIKTQVKFNEVHGDIESQDFQAFIT